MRYAGRYAICYFFDDLTVYTAIMLLARCGLRISEPTRLRIEHYHREEGSIYIEKTKFHKDRLIPIPNACIANMENYLSVRSAFMANVQNPYLLPGPGEKRLSQNRIYAMFHQSVKALGIYQPRRVIANTVFGAPTPHSLRHSFAINTLKSIRDSGRSAQEALPILSAYLGHRKYRYTAVYLKVIDA
ncbi:MAG: tyrosine-type recombinase/integrase, partial [Deltaproteobacteria bacterium]|nr:tyrosine-type recombinase/integrase [Deltaproteobacteria bacterium]